MKRLLVALIVCSSIIISSPASASLGHYLNGGEGLKLASLPPEGFYYKLYNIYYTAARYKTDKSTKLDKKFNVDVFAQSHRFIYSSPWELLGGTLFFDVIVPFVYTDFYMQGAGNRDSMYALGDILLEPFVLTWHGARFDALIGFSLYFPVGYYHPNQPSSAGKGFWTFMFSAGGTFYFDEAKTWHVSTILRYQTHTRQYKTNIVWGDNFSFEWGAGKTIGNFDIGVAGYCAWQVTKDIGPHASNQYSAAFAIGPEIGYAIPEWGVGITGRALFEFGNRTGTEGFIGTLSITKAF